MNAGNLRKELVSSFPCILLYHPELRMTVREITHEPEFRSHVEDSTLITLELCLISEHSFYRIVKLQTIEGYGNFCVAFTNWLKQYKGEA